MRTVLVIAAMLSGACPVTKAQSVNRCQIDARVLYQAHACPATTPRAPATAPVDAPKKKSLSELLRERDGPGRARPAPRDEPVADGANVLPAMMGAF